MMPSGSGLSFASGSRSFGLELHASKTRLIEFGRFAAEHRQARGLAKPETFDFLGFTHICGKHEEAGRFKLKRITIKKRLRAKLRTVKTELTRRRHLPIPEQGEWLASVVRGHRNYYAVPDNIYAVEAFHQQAIEHWYRALRRRSQRTSLTWKRMGRVQARWLPPVTHHASLARRALRRQYPRQEPSALGSGRQGCDPAGESPVMLIVRVEHVATPHPGPGNRPGDAWCERPGCPAAFALLRWEQPGGRASVGARR